MSKMTNLYMKNMVLESSWGRNIRDYIESIEGDLAKGWKWSSLDFISIHDKDKLFLNDILKERRNSFNLGWI